MANKMCNVCGKRRVGSGGKNHDGASAALIGLCGLCDTEGGWENTHSDNGHEGLWERFEIIQAGGEATPLTSDELYTIDECRSCWICRPELNEAQREPRKAGKATGERKVTTRRPQLNHRTQCTHPQTPEARRECRKAFWAAEAAKAEKASKAEAPAKRDASKVRSGKAVRDTARKAAAGKAARTSK